MRLRQMENAFIKAFFVCIFVICAGSGMVIITFALLTWYLRRNAFEFT